MFERRKRHAEQACSSSNDNNNSSRPAHTPTAGRTWRLLYPRILTNSDDPMFRALSRRVLPLWGALDPADLEASRSSASASSSSSPCSSFPSSRTSCTAIPSTRHPRWRLLACSDRWPGSRSPCSCRVCMPAWGTAGGIGPWIHGYCHWGPGAIAAVEIRCGHEETE